MDDFNADYYSTLAQVVPTLFVAALATRYFKERGSEETSRLQHLILIGTMLVVVFGEIAIIEALREREDPSSATSEVITFAVLAPLFMVTSDLLGQPFFAVLWSLPDRWQVWVLRLIAVLLPLGGISTFVFSDSTAGISWILLIFLIIVGVVYLYDNRPPSKRQGD